MTSYLVTMATDHHLTYLKMRARDKRTATVNVRDWCFIVQEKNQKTWEGGGNPFPLPLVPPRVFMEQVSLVSSVSVFTEEGFANTY